MKNKDVSQQGKYGDREREGQYDALLKLRCRGKNAPVVVPSETFQHQLSVVLWRDFRIKADLSRRKMLVTVFSLCKL